MGTLRSLIPDTVKQFNLAQGKLLVPSMAFTSLLSLLPYFAVSLFVFQFLGGFDVLFSQINNQTLREALPKNTFSFLGQWQPAVIDYFGESLNQSVLTQAKSLVADLNFNTIGGYGLILLLISAFKFVRETDNAVQRIWQLPKRNKLIKHLFWYAMVIFMAPILVGLALQIYKIQGLQSVKGFIEVFRIAFPWSLITFIFYFGPNTKNRFIISLLSALLTVAAMSGLKFLFIYLVKNVFTFNKMYGSLAAFPILLIFTWSFWFVFLMGIAFNSRLEKVKKF